MLQEFQPSCNIHSLYITRVFSGRGLTSVRDCVEEELVGADKYIGHSAKKTF